MRRTVFYLLVGLLAFGISSFVALKFYYSNSQKLSSFSEIKLSEIAQQSSSQNELISEDNELKYKMDSFKPTIEKWLRDEKLPNLVELNRTDDAAIGEYQAGITLLDLNNDGNKELAFETGCAIGGNCELWIFQKTDTGHRLILSADMMQSFKPINTKTNDYYDLETKTRSGSRSGGIEIYKFDGKEYKVAKCFTYEYEDIGMKNGQIVTKNKPTLIPMECERVE